jgi:hypothetical protein
MSASSSTVQHDETQIGTMPISEPSVSRQGLIDNLNTDSQTTPILVCQMLTQDEQENNLIIDIDAIIYNFLKQFNEQRAYDTVLQWTRNDFVNLEYDIVLSINRRQTH